jgi:tRNA uridine 5-carboxymethylaminomethyl modification enzyme
LGGSLSREEVVGLFPGSKKNRVLQAAPAKNFIKRPEVSINSMPKRYFSFLENTAISPHWAQEVLFEVETQIKYEGYIKRQRNQVDRMLKQENVSIPPDIDYSKINTISLEAREKLQFVKPETLGQAFRVSGVTPADISVLSVLLYK